MLSDILCRCLGGERQVFWKKVEQRPLASTRRGTRGGGPRLSVGPPCRLHHERVGPDTFKILFGFLSGMSPVAQWDKSPDSSVQDIINIFSQILLCVSDVERGLGFMDDYTHSSLLEASLALR